MRRRTFLQNTLLAGLGLSSGAACQRVQSITNTFQPHVVVIGAGFGGAVAARYLRKFDKKIRITLVERNPLYVSSPASNWVLGGMRPVKSITFDYRRLEKYDIRVINNTVTAIDPFSKEISLQNEENKINFTRVIISPGIDFRFDTIKNYTQENSELIAHAWQGVSQISLLHKQLIDLRDGGVVVISVPEYPYRCPAGPYERASLMAHYCKQYKPKCKIIILDSKDQFIKQNLFEAGWKKYYGYGTDKSMIEWLPLSQQGKVIEVDVASKQAITESAVHKADILNIIPPQKAGKLAFSAGLVDSNGWCSVDPVTFESKKMRNIHVIGDAVGNLPLVKTGVIAGVSAKLCALNVVNLIRGRQVATPVWFDVSYSKIAPNHAISSMTTYRMNSQGKIVTANTETTPLTGADHMREAMYADSWFINATHEMYG